MPFPNTKCEANKWHPHKINAFCLLLASLLEVKTCMQAIKKKSEVPHLSCNFNRKWKENEISFIYSFFLN